MPKITREEIFAVFEKLVARFGLDRVTMRELARECGVSVGTIYRHFDSKEALIVSIEDRWLDHVRLRNETILAGGASPEAKLHELVVVHVARLSELIRADQAVFELLMGALRLRYVGRDVPDVRRQIMEAMIASAATVFVEGNASGELDVVDADRDARHFIEAFADFFSAGEVIKRPHAEIVQGAEGMFEFLMRTIRRHPRSHAHRRLAPEDRTA